MQFYLRCWVLPALFIMGGAMPWQAVSAPPSADTVDLLLVLAVDVSDSITPAKARLQRAGYVRAIAHPDVVAAIRNGRHGSVAVSYLEWASANEQHQLIGWRRIADAESARAFAEELRRAPYEYGYWTSISAAIDRATAMIELAPFAAARRVIDLSSDGRNNQGGPVLAARARALERNITINGLIVLSSRRNFSLPPQPRLKEYFSRCVVGGSGAFTEVAEGPDDLVRTVRRKLVREIAGLPNGHRDGHRAAAGGLHFVSQKSYAGTDDQTKFCD